MSNHEITKMSTLLTHLRQILGSKNIYKLEIFDNFFHHIPFCQTEHPIPFEDAILHILLPNSPDYHLKDGTTVSVTGWKKSKVKKRWKFFSYTYVIAYPISFFFWYTSITLWKRYPKKNSKIKLLRTYKKNCLFLPLCRHV